VFGTCLSPHPEAPTCPCTPEVLQAKGRAPTPYPSDIFTLDSHLSLSRSLGMHQIRHIKDGNIFILNRDPKK